MKSARGQGNLELFRHSDAYWRVTFNIPPLNIFGPSNTPQLKEAAAAVELNASPMRSAPPLSNLISAGYEALVPSSGEPARELLENEFTRLLTADPGVAADWIAMARVIAVSLWCTLWLFAGAVLLALAAFLLRWVKDLL